MAVEPIEIPITGNADKFEKAVDKSEKRAGKFGRTLDATSRRLAVFGDRATNLGKRMSGITAGMVVAGGAMFAMASASADVGNRIDKTSKSAGVSSDAYQELAFALGQVSDVSDEQVGKALSRLTRSMGDAADGVKLPLEAFEKLGISQSELKAGTVTTEEAFERLVVAMQDTKSPAEAAALGAALMGREGAKLGPILRESGSDIDALRQKAHDLGIVLSKKSVASAAEFTDKMDELKRQMGAVKDEVGTALVPIFTSVLIPAIQNQVIPALQGLGDKVNGIVDFFVNLPGPVQEAAGLVAAALGAGGPILLAVGFLSKALSGLVLASGPIGLFIGAAVLLTTAWVKWGDDIKIAIGSAVDWVTEKITGMMDFIGGLPERMVQIGRDIINGLKQGIQDKFAELKEYMFSLAEELPNWMKKMLGIQSPSRVFMEIGGFIGQGLAEGIKKSQALTEQAIKGTAKGAVGATDSMVGSVLGSMSQLFTKSKGLAIAQALVNTWQGATEALKLPFPANIAAFAQTLATGMGAVKSIKSTTQGSSGTSGGGAAVAAPAPKPLQVSLEGVSDGNWYSGRNIHDMLDHLSDAAGDRGMIIMQPA
jgi:hypothetical protein